MTLAAGDPFTSLSLALMKATLDYNTRLAALALTISASALDFAFKVWTVKSPSELAEVVTNHTRDQFDAISEEVEEFSALMQKAAPGTAEDAEFSLGD
jgi:hypothetical protein